MLRVHIFLLWLLTLVQFNSVRAQVLPAFGATRAGTTGMQFLKIGPDARSAGLSGNFVALVNDVSAVYWNPAGLALLDTQRYHFQMGQTQYWADIGISYLSAVRRFSGGSAIGLSVVGLNSGEMPVTTEFQPFGTGETFTANSSLVGLTYAQSLTDMFSFGISAKWARENLAGVVTQNLLTDFGFAYQIGLRNATLAVCVSNFGVNVRPDGSLQRLRLTGRDTLTEFEEISVPALFRVGLAFDVLNQESHRIRAAVQLNHPTDNRETLGLGGEYAYKKLLFARMGYELGVDEALLPSFGVGFVLPRRFGALRLDYGFNNKTRLGSVHRFTLGIALQ
ncbi:MAG: PorV/PorQ family protein [Bacteroidota bacterium]